MKLRLAVVLLMVFGLAACSQYTCPTYTNNDVEKTKVISEKERV